MNYFSDDIPAFPSFSPKKFYLYPYDRNSQSYFYKLVKRNFHKSKKKRDIKITLMKELL